MAWQKLCGMNHQFTMAQFRPATAGLWRGARQTHEVAVMRPNPAGELRETLHEPVTGIQHLRAGCAQLGQEGPRLPVAPRGCAPPPIADTIKYVSMPRLRHLSPWSCSFFSSLWYPAFGLRPATMCSSW